MWPHAGARAFRGHGPSLFLCQEANGHPPRLARDRHERNALREAGEQLLRPEHAPSLRRLEAFSNQVRRQGRWREGGQHHATEPSRHDS